MDKILITGGTGSFGSVMVERLIQRTDVSEIIVFSRDELKQYEMRTKIKSSRVRFVVGDVRDKHALDLAMRRVDTVFHAAAFKQVPTGEFFPMELVKTNVIGTQNVLDSAEESGSVKKVVVLSTDKAVYPINTMGISKALSERLVTGKGYHATGTIFCMVRYGNVMASRGSVIPLIVQKIKEQEQIPLTEPTMTRFLLSLDDAIDLVFLAIEKGEQGDLFIKKAPAATVEDLARAVLNVFNAQNPITIVGARAGEKIHETLATHLELLRSEDLGGHFRVRSQQGTHPEEFFERGTRSRITEDYTSANTTRLSIKEIENLLWSLNYIKDKLKSL